MLPEVILLLTVYITQPDASDASVLQKLQVKLSIQNCRGYTNCSFRLLQL